MKDLLLLLFIYLFRWTAASLPVYTHSTVWKHIETFTHRIVAPEAADDILNPIFCCCCCYKCVVVS